MNETARIHMESANAQKGTYSEQKITIAQENGFPELGRLKFRGAEVKRG